MITSFGIIGGNPAIFQSRQARAEEARKKRQAAQHHDQQEREKRARTSSSAEYVPIIPSASSHNVLQNYDITQIPLQGIVSLCMTVLQTVPLEVMSERVSILPPEGVTLAVRRPGFQRSSTPPYPPPIDAPTYIKSSKYRREGEDIKTEGPEDVPIKQEVSPVIDSDDDMIDSYVPPSKMEYELIDVDLKEEEDRPKVEVLPSAEERASQSLKMKPYELEEQAQMSNSEKKLFIKMAVERVFKNMAMYLNSRHTDRKTLTDSTATTVSPASDVSSDQNRWFSIIAKLVTKGIDIEPDHEQEDQTEMEDNKDTVMDIDSEDTVSDIKDMLIDFIAEDLPQR